MPITRQRGVIHRQVVNRLPAPRKTLFHPPKEQPLIAFTRKHLPRLILLQASPVQNSTLLPHDGRVHSVAAGDD